MSASLTARFPFSLQAWWVGEGFYADVWRVCTNGTNCTEIGDKFQGERGWRELAEEAQWRGTCAPAEAGQGVCPRPAQGEGDPTS